MPMSYLENLNDLTGHIHKQKSKKTDKHPDYAGQVKIDGKIYNVAGWHMKNLPLSLTLKFTEYKEKKDDLPF
mgnify:CR=1 FL=1